jgi:hypothetical protein
LHWSDDGERSPLTITDYAIPDRLRRRDLMRPFRIATLLCVGAIAASGCGTDSDDRVSASSRSGPSAAEPALAEVPDVTGEKAEAGSSALEAAGFEPAFDPDPDDPSLCTVSDQDQIGEIEEGSEVILTLECKVDVPDLSDKPADDAVAQLDDLGLTTSYDKEPEDSSACTVEDQDVVGEAEPESEVVLSVLCKLPDVTGEDLESAVSELELIGYNADHRVVRDPSACTVTSHKAEAEPGATIDLAVHCAGTSPSGL